MVAPWTVTNTWRQSTCLYRKGNVYSDHKLNSYSHVPHKAVSVHNTPHVRWWSCKVKMDLNLLREMEGVIFLSWEQCLWGLAVDSLSHLSFECTGDTPVHHPLTCFSTGDPVPLALHTQRARQPPPHPPTTTTDV